MKEKPRLLMVVRLKNDGGLTEVLNYNSDHYESCLVDKSFGLRIFNVLNNDLGSYYCGVVEGKRMQFEEGVQIYGNIILEKCHGVCIIYLFIFGHILCLYFQKPKMKISLTVKKVTRHYYNTVYYISI